MLVTLASGSSVGAGSSQMFQYAPKSFQAVYIHWAGTASDFDECTMQVQVGNEVVANSINLWALQLFHGVTKGGYMVADEDQTEYQLGVNFGSWEMLSGQEVYVTIQNNSAAGVTLDVTLSVNGIQPFNPIYYRDFSDTSFTCEQVKQSYIWSSALISGDTQAIQITNSQNSTSPNVESCVSVASADGLIDNAGAGGHIGQLTKGELALDTTYNYTTAPTVGGILCQCVGNKVAPTPNRNAQRRARQAVAGLKPNERRSL